MLRAILGLLKGLVVGGGVGFGLLRLGLAGNSAVTYAACAVVGALVGVIAGRAPWRAETIWTPAVKAIFGGAIGAALCFAGRRFLPDASFTVADLGKLSLRDGPILATAVGVLYGIFVEIDDGGADDKKAEAAKSLPAARK
jgi:hypothetical protein